MKCTCPTEEERGNVTSHFVLKSIVRETSMSRNKLQCREILCEIIHTEYATLRFICFMVDLDRPPPSSLLHITNKLKFCVITVKSTMTLKYKTEVFQKTVLVKAVLKLVLNDLLFDIV